MYIYDASVSGEIATVHAVCVVCVRSDKLNSRTKPVFFYPSGHNEFAQTRFTSESIYIRTLRAAITVTRARTYVHSKSCVLLT